MDTPVSGADKVLVDGLRQQAINEVLERLGGVADRSQIEAALVNALQKLNLTIPSEKWLEEVAIEIALGKPYIVSAESQSVAEVLQEGHLPPTPDVWP